MDLFGQQRKEFAGAQGIGNLPTAESGHARSFFINPRLFKALFGLL